VREGGTSLTAQRVAAYRCGFERSPAPFGDPGADQLLCQDVAGQLGAGPGGPMARYLQARTTFFDRVLLNSLERGITQVLIVGAGYDGRALRYAKPGVSWFELDHPATQADKRRRLERLGLDSSHVSFVAADFNHGGVAAAMLAGGYRADVPSVLLCEGVAVYLDRPVLDELLRDLRAISAHGSRLTISLSVASDDPEVRAQRQRFAEGVGALGEPARLVLGPGEGAALLGAAGWAPRELTDRARRAGFVVAEAAWVPTGQSEVPGSSELTELDEVRERANHRAGVDGLARHLELVYGTRVTGLVRLDLGVYRVDRAEGQSWVARLFARSRPRDEVRGDAAILELLEANGFPAERAAHPEPVTVHEGQGLLVTRFVDGTRPRADPETYGVLGDLLGRLHTLGSGVGRPGGAWHHLVHQGTVADEMAAAISLLEQSRPSVPPGQEGAYEVLKQELGSGNSFAGLPEALAHPDFVLPNVVSSAEGLVVVDWAGTGRGPRLACIGWALWAAGASGQGCVDALVAGYRRYVQLDPEELERLEVAIGFRRLVLQTWSSCVGRQSLSQVVERLPAARAHAQAVASRARHLMLS
jgi:methyltransferase (TIGR00027 family)